ncbi:hypothetical protein SpiGrapes_3234 [Sphaerochaeta pleomorpha str. Grapes]|uniref:GH29D-like beta-sandwich domain-containing protein n=1 Tax=Sphaerochaeta pleomorpha (strain ATCC BAA-1885 / DSM 22778 / Grapes) TaxID=158190 RepID=G8QR43_SPHPG|nr:chitobiase/beta-hexosaminidase C-terminal domain-containing protein [Sphaerochaeta pleomorpha]AEV30978.1 hypothetical protein SpiGrapes_3234 [Sphaerochaeta pleomorpha str. Grapes]
MNRRSSFSGFLFLCFAMLIAITLIVGCESNIQNKVGSLTVSTGAQEKTISPDSTLIEIASYQVRGVYSDGVTTFSQQSPINTIVINDLLVGDWTITFEGLNSFGTVIASATQMVTINAGYNTTVTFVLTSVSGVGTCELTLSWPVTVTSVHRITVRLTAASSMDVFDVEAFAFEATQVGDIQQIMKTIADIPVGSYALKAQFWDVFDAQIGLTLMETVNIYADMTSTGLFALPEFLFPVEKPTFDPMGGRITPEQTIELTTASIGATIYYTIDGTDPNTTSIEYEGPFTLPHNATVKAIALKNCMFASAIASAVFEIPAAMPTILPVSGTYSMPQEVTLFTETAGATIYYTTDGSAPDTFSILYTGPFMVSQDTTVRAIATHPDFGVSEEVSAEYIIVNSVGLVTVDPANYTVEIIVPPEWTGGPVITNVWARIWADVEPDPTGVTYTWYLDGEEARNQGGEIASTSDYLDLGIGLDRVAIGPGPHSITVTVTAGELSFSDYYWFCASDTATIGASSFAIGDVGPAGGLVFYDDEEDGIDDLPGYRYLEAAPEETEWENRQWGAYGYSVDPSALGTALGYGMPNTENIVSYHDSLGTLYPLKGDYYTNPGAYYFKNDGSVAAKLCADLEYGGYDDWFLPSKGELDLMFTIIRKCCPSDWCEHSYWSSSEFSPTCAWLQSFAWSQWKSPKFENHRVKAVRAF